MVMRKSFSSIKLTKLALLVKTKRSVKVRRVLRPFIHSIAHVLQIIVDTLTPLNEVGPINRTSTQG